MSSYAGYDLMRMLLPRRRLSILNTFLASLLASFVLVIAVREWLNKVTTLPPGESQTWLPLLPNSTTVLGQGENGEPVVLNDTEKSKGDSSMKKWHMNIVASKKVSPDRNLPDTRPDDCLRINYKTSRLPTASVIVAFTNEAWTTLLRTVHSIINQSPLDLLYEIVLVDDNSSQNDLKDQLDDYIIRFGGKVRIIRLRQREGVIRAKLIGAEQARAEVVVFLDSHCEVTAGWLEPLLARIAEKRNTIVCPIVNPISATTFSYSSSSEFNKLGGFHWNLQFRWESLPEGFRIENKTKPIPTPTMPSGMFAVDREYFLKMGGFDPGMEIWGGENIEVSFRIWMCGGSIEFIPCSYIGHVVRDGHPFTMLGPNNDNDVHASNLKRVAEVWMDDYKRLFYIYRRNLNNKNVGDLTERIQLRKRLMCKDFSWYLDKVVHGKFVIDENAIAYGNFRNVETGLCLDTMQKNEVSEIGIKLFYCQNGSSPAQLFSLTEDGQFRRELSCAKIKENDRKRIAILVPCSKSGETGIWKWEENGLMRNIPSNSCMDVKNLKSGDDVELKECNVGDSHQKWEFV